MMIYVGLGKRIVACTVILLWPVMGLASAQQGGSDCQADEIHWTITGSRSITLDWRGTATSVRYGLTSAFGSVAKGEPPHPMPFSSAGPFREANLAGLKANALYHYSIGSCPAHTFRTPPFPGSSGFYVDAEGDIGDSIHYKGVLPDQRLIAEQAPAFVLAVGDLTAGDNGQAAVDRHFNDVMGWSQDAAYMPAWGNEDWDHPKSDDLRKFKGQFAFPHPQTSPGAPRSGCCGKDWSWFDYGNTRFIAYPEPYTSQTWADWYAKAATLMDKAEADPNITFIVTFGHRPPYTSGYHHSALQLRNYVNILGSHHSKYVLNLNGHSHDYERSKAEDGVVSITVGTGGSELEERPTACLFRVCPRPSWSAFRAMHFGVLRLHITSTKIQGYFVCGPAGGGKNDIHCAPGSIVDHFTIRADHHQAAP
jgi:Iron/zinc purple acid phosphatase-like protein C/Calcineurin-like phosphoesterase